MDIETRIDATQVILLVRGRLIRADCSRLGNTLTRLLDEGHRRFVLDFSEVSEIDSSGLGALVATGAAAERRGAHIRIEGASDRMSDLLSTTQILPPDE